MQTRNILAAASAVLVLAAAPASAQSYADVKGMDERFRLDLGGFFQQFDTTLRLDSTTLGRGTEINMEDDFGQDAHKTSFRGTGYWRFGRHGRFDFGVLTWSRSATPRSTATSSSAITCITPARPWTRDSRRRRWTCITRIPS